MDRFLYFFADQNGGGHVAQSAFPNGRCSLLEHQTRLDNQCATVVCEYSRDRRKSLWLWSDRL